MSGHLSRLRRKLWRADGALARLLRQLQRDPPMVQGSFYLLRRQCGKPNCRCRRVMDRSLLDNRKLSFSSRVARKVRPGTGGTRVYSLETAVNSGENIFCIPIKTW